MMTPHQQDLWSSSFAELYNALEGETIRTLIKRINSGKTDILDWQVEAMKNLHLYNQDVAKLLSQVTGVAEDQIIKGMQQAGRETVIDVDKALPFEPNPLPNNLDDIIRNFANQAWGEIDNLVNQTLITTTYGIGTATQAYQQVLNRTQALYNTGLTTKTQALQRAVSELAQQGIKSTFVDRGGHTWSMERYVGVVLNSTLANTFNQLRTERMAEYGVYTVIVTSHMGAREACARIQGNVVDLRRNVPFGSKYRSIYDPYWRANYGTAGGHRGVNCHHLHIPFVPGVNENHQPKFNAEENKKVAELRKRQRQLERAIVKHKKNKMVADEFGDEEESKRSQQFITANQKRMRELVESNDYLSRNYSREKVYTPLKTLIQEMKS